MPRFGGYPDALFQYLASVCLQTTLACDCATGNGQAAMGLACAQSVAIIHRDVKPSNVSVHFEN